MALRSVHVSVPPPTVASRAYALVSTAMYDAWAFYDKNADGVHLTERGKKIKHPDVNKSISFAAYRVLYDMWPLARPILDAKMASLGYNISDTTMDLTSCVGVGNQAASLLMQARLFDGSNQKGNFPGAPVFYSDWTNYTPRNDPSPAAMRAIDNWQPLLIPVTNGTAKIQSFATPHWNMVTPFALTNGAEFRSRVAPALYKSNATRPDLIRQAWELVEWTKNLTDETKIIAEMFADGPNSVLPAGHWHFFATDISKRDQHTVEEDAKMFLMLGNAMLDAGIACWDNKRFYDNARPATLIPILFKGINITGWHTPCGGKVNFDLANWIPYQLSTVVTPPFAEYSSGHSTFSAAGAEILRSFTGSDVFGGQQIIPANASVIEGGCGIPANDVVVNYPTFTSAAAISGLSRRMGGIHFEQADLEGRRAGKLVGQKVFERCQQLFKGKKKNNSNAANDNLVAGSSDTVASDI
eukprot:gene7324-8528_t